MNKRNNNSSRTPTAHINANLVDLTIREWTSRKKDKKATAHTTKHFNTSAKAGNFNKNLLPFESETYNELRAAIADLRDFHRKNTLPWTEDGGLRVCTSQNYMPYCDGTRERRATIEACAEKFFSEFHGMIKRAEQELNGMFDSDDYPSLPVLKSKFGVSVKFYPMPKPEAFEADEGVSPEEVDEMRKQLTKDLADVQAAGLKDLWKRLAEVIGHVQEVLGAKTKKRVHQSLFDDVAEVCEILPRLNISNDPDLIRIAKEVADKLGNVDRAFVAKSPKVRSQIAKDAARIQKEMEAFMGVSK
jgi:hypothetical protein